VAGAPAALADVCLGLEVIRLAAVRNNYDPKYRIRHKVTSIKRLYKPQTCLKFETEDSRSRTSLGKPCYSLLDLGCGCRGCRS